MYPFSIFGDILDQTLISSFKASKICAPMGSIARNKKINSIFACFFPNTNKIFQDLVQIYLLLELHFNFRWTHQRHLIGHYSSL